MGRRIALFVILSLISLGLFACTTERATETPLVAPTATATAEPSDTAAPVDTATQEPTRTAVPPTQAPATSPPGIQAFADQLMQALERQDPDQLQGLMGESFMIAGWRSEGTAYPPADAVEQLQNNYLGAGTALAYDPDKDLRAILDGMDPLAILGPDVRDPRAMFVSGWGPQGEDEALLYIAHNADGIPYWYGVLFAFGGFTPGPSEGQPETETVLAIPEAGIAVALPPGHLLMKNPELHRRGSFAAYDFLSPGRYVYPYLAEIQFFSRESIADFASRCPADSPCFYGDYPDVARYDAQRAAYEAGQELEGFNRQVIVGRDFFVSEHACEGVPCVVREYTTFAGGFKVDLWVMMADPAQAEAADALARQLRIQDDWAGIGSMPGPLYTLLEPGVTLRQPLGWVVREEAGGQDDFVARAVSFVPPTMATSEQPQVPSIDLFVYSPPLTDTLEAWLATYSTASPFGSAAGPEVFFFGVNNIAPVNLAAILGLTFSYDVLGLPAHQLLFSVRDTVVGLSYVDSGTQELRPAYLQMQSSLTRSNATVLAEQTDVRTILAVVEVPIRLGPAESYSQLGTLVEGQIALVTGASQDGDWWRVICPNDVIADCWVPADPGLTQPTTPPGAATGAISTWIEYRDERYGYGLAVPCHWPQLPPPPEGNFATLTLRSYDDQFFAANSVRGEWLDGRWPAGALKMDLTVVDGVPPEQGLAATVSELLSGSDLTTLERVTETTLGTHPAVTAVTARVDDSADQFTTMAVRLASDRVMLLSVYPQEAWGASDVQGVLGSLALSDDEPVTVPAFPPAPALIDVPEACAG